MITDLPKGEYFFDYSQMHRLVERLAKKIIADEFDPDYIIAIGTGGFIPARILKIYLTKKILTVRLSHYDDQDKPMDQLQKIQWLDNDVEKLFQKKVLLVDEVNDTGQTLEFTLRELLLCKPQEIAVMVLHDKEKAKKGHIPPEIKRYYVGDVTGPGWIHYPWEARDIDYQNYMAAKFQQKAGKYIFD